MKTSETIAGRRSVRAYLEQSVSDADVERIVEAGRWAPNIGPFHVTVLRRRELRQRLNDATHQAMLSSGIEFLRMRASLPGYQPLYGAPVTIIVSGPTNDPYAAIHCALAAENMLLQATDLGLASCFIVSPSLALNNDVELTREVGLPDGYGFQCGVIVGYPADTDPFSNPHREPKGTVSYVD